MSDDAPESPEVDAVLGPDGVLARHIPHYEDRPLQRRVAAAVFRSLANDTALLVEAGTGTGKTLAYLVPALLSEKRVVVSTGTRALQDQITRHDLPLLRELLPSGFHAVTLKGVANYLCLRKLADLMTRESLPDGVSADDFAAVAAWAEYTETGDRADFDHLPEDAPIWSALTQTPETRMGPRCPYYERCFITRARRSADKADLILVNHHLFFADLALRVNYPGARVLPEYQAVVFDEAHQLEDVLTEHFGVRVSTTRLGQLCRDARHTLIGPGDLFARALTDGHDTSERIIAHVERSAAEFFLLMRQYIGARGTAEDPASFERVELERDLFSTSEREDAWYKLDNALDELAAQADSEGRDCVKAEEDEKAEALFALARRATLVREDLAALAEQSADAFVYWGEARGSGVFLCGAPIDVSPYMNAHVLESVPSAILTSATLSTGHSFEYLRDRLGLDSELVDDLLVDSPFDYQNQAILYIARDLPDPREPDFLAAACERMRALIDITDGRAFLLFTSHRALREAARRLEAALARPLLVQGQRPKARLLAEFRTTPGALLLGTSSFWEGVDVPGDSLSLVIIDKLPFASPADPLMAARMRFIERNHRDPFAELQVPKAALALKQGFGRLIRRNDDRGIVAVLDRRLLARGYGQVFLDTLPPGLRRTSVLEQVRRFWLEQALPGPDGNPTEGSRVQS